MMTMTTALNIAPLVVTTVVDTALLVVVTTVVDTIPLVVTTVVDTVPLVAMTTVVDTVLMVVGVRLSASAVGTTVVAALTEEVATAMVVVAAAVEEVDVMIKNRILPICIRYKNSMTLLEHFLSALVKDSFLHWSVIKITSELSLHKLLHRL